MVDWVLKPMLPDQNAVSEESMFHHVLCMSSAVYVWQRERHSLLTLHDAFFPGFS